MNETSTNQPAAGSLAAVIPFPVERRAAAISAEFGARRRHPSAGRTWEPPDGRCS